MSTPRFPGPSINRLVENDPQIVKVPMAQTGWGGSKQSQPKDIKNKMTIRHVGEGKKR